VRYDASIGASVAEQIKGAGIAHSGEHDAGFELEAAGAA
jgi:hypothetical protein